MNTREKLLKTVKDILIGPNPLPGFTQNNGEEILFNDSPLKTYISGILFPQVIMKSEEIGDENEPMEESSEANVVECSSETGDIERRYLSDKNIAEPITESETSKINNYRQSAMGITLCVSEAIKNLHIDVSVGSYTEKEADYPREQKAIDGERSFIISGPSKICYFRQQHNLQLDIMFDDLPNRTSRYKEYYLKDDKDNLLPGIAIAVTFRLKNSETKCIIYTVTLINTRKSSETINACACWYQAGFSVSCDCTLKPLPDNYCYVTNDEDYKLNALLYRDVKTYAIGHGCAAMWDDRSDPTKITAEVMPEYEVKPIFPTSLQSVKLSMKLYSTEKEKTIEDLKLLCDAYYQWIDIEEKKVSCIEEKHRVTAIKQIELCKICLNRMRCGVELLSNNKEVLTAFQLANRAMLMQQLHYKLPLTEYDDYDDIDFCGILKDNVCMPDFDDESTWYNNKGNYGKWRPFQIAFLLMNLKSFNDKKCEEREIVDLIWFPTGGGKTEAYLGLTAYAIFLRRILDPNDGGTTVIMRYTLRLLTAQQYERAAALICSMEKLRSENPELLGYERITIGLWVGDSLTKNNSEQVVSKIKEIQNGKSNENVSVMLKCPWCGASMETYKDKKGSNRTPGYSYNKKRVLFKCDNPQCRYHDVELPLNLFDDEIYAHPPTLLFGTVDKFAMLPYRPEAKSLFGGDNERTPPELIIQDELHLITGPLGSTVGLYETLIEELCKHDGIKPKIVASTATISHAKRQCNALYGRGEDKVFQFPVQGTSYRNCFFAEEKSDAVGRKYIGLYGSAAPSSATASIYTFAAFLYAAKSIAVANEKDRDPYWTNLAYFGSMRELGQAATWFIADIKEHLEVIYRSRMESSLDKTNRRYIYENGLAELTSRMPNDDIPKILKSLEVALGEKDKHPLDVCLATNMVSVGVDISRLGLMTVTGQPKSMSEYIQATSRVGRDASAPGLVFVIYNTSKSRDKSHYEKFQSQHSKLYYSVEPTSVTPFSRPLRERALHAVFVALYRFFVDIRDRNDATKVPTKAEFDKIADIIINRAAGIDPQEVDDIKDLLYKKWREWLEWLPEKYSSLSGNEETAPLLCPAGTLKPISWDGRGWDTPTSMRNVDRECGLDCSKGLIREDKNDG